MCQTHTKYSVNNGYKYNINCYHMPLLHKNKAAEI